MFVVWESKVEEQIQGGQMKVKTKKLSLKEKYLTEDAFGKHANGVLERIGDIFGVENGKREVK